MKQRLILTVGAGHGSDDLAAALTQDVAAAVIAEGHPASAALTNLAQGAGVAALTATSDSSLPTGVDGAHGVGVLDARAALLASRPRDASIGVIADNRHEAMLLGEAGADYIWYGASAALTETGAKELCAWWSALFEVPAVMAGELIDIEALCATRADFIAVTDLLDQPDPAAAVREAARHLGEAAP